MRNYLFIFFLTLATLLQAQDFDFNEVAYTKEKTTFKLFAPQKAKRVIVEYGELQQTGGDRKTVRMKYDKRGFWKAEVKKDMLHQMYRFSVDGQYSVGVFAKAVGVNGSYAQVIDMKETDPEGWEHDKRPFLRSPADLVIYEMHHRDFSVAKEGAAYPGKYLALTEPWAIEHLKSLGVNAIHILPSYDYGSVDETRLNEPQYNWGYDPVNYNVPEGSYSTNPYEPACRIREFKQMVQALHEHGIRVILDVVYNHTFDIDNSNFQKTYPDYYYRKRADGSYSDGSGCGNETASEQPMMRRFMIASVRHWINEYHIDGFRFDLMGCHDIETMNEIRQAVDAIDPTIFIYGEGWSAGACSLPVEQLGVKANTVAMPGVAAFSDEIRDALRGPFSDDTKGAFLAGIPGEEESLKFGIVGAVSHPQVDMEKVNYSKRPWAAEPTQMISYVSCHDDMCLVDRLKASIPDITIDELIRLDLLAQTAVFTSQGVPFMLCGEELLRTKQGVHNSFKSPDAINQLDWQNKTRYPQVFAYYKGLISMRKNHPAFRMGCSSCISKHLEFLPSQNCVVAFCLKGKVMDDSWKNIIVVLNANKEVAEVTIPDGKYTVVACDGTIDENGLGEINGGTVVVEPQSALIIHQ